MSTANSPAHTAQTQPLTPPPTVAGTVPRKQWMFAAALGAILLIAAFVGWSAWQVFDTMGTLNSRTAPPSIVAGSVLGGSPEVQIDTGPAKTAVAMGSSYPTATVIPSETPVPSDTPVPTASLPNVTAPDETATPAPTPTITPEPTVLSEIDRVKNGSFESGADDWYITNESGITIVAADDAPDGSSVLQVPTGGYGDQTVFFVPDTEYVLAASGKVEKKGDYGRLGVIYFDADGNRLQDQEPTPLTFKGTKFAQQQVAFTIPEDAATVKLFVFKENAKDNELGAFFLDQISLHSVVEAYEEGGSALAPPELAPGSMTILVMGVDAREGEAIDGEVRPDSLMVIHLDPASDSCRVLSIPRDTRTDLPGYGLTKINHALAVGGIPYEQQVVSNLLNLPIDHYVLVDFNGFEDLVDALGGVTVDVPAGFTAINTMVFEPGLQEMTGKQTLTYARHRGDNEGDFGRIQRQQAIIRALIAQTGGLDVVSSFNELLPAIGNNFRTDMSLQEMINLASTYRSICTDDAVTLLSLDGEIATYQDPLLNMPLSYVVVDEAEIRRKVSELLEL